MGLKNFLTGGDKVAMARDEIKRLEAKSAERGEAGKGLKPLDQTRLAGAKSVVSTYRAKLMGWGAGLFIAAGAGYMINNHMDEVEQTESLKVKAPSTPIEHFVPKEKEDFKQKIEFQEFWKTTALEALGEFEQHPKVSELKKFMETNAFYTLPIDAVRTMHIVQGTAKDAIRPMENKQSFEMVFMPEEYAKHYHSSIITEAGGKTIRVMAAFRLKQ